MEKRKVVIQFKERKQFKADVLRKRRQELAEQSRIYGLTIEDKREIFRSDKLLSMTDFSINGEKK